MRRDLCDASVCELAPQLQAREISAAQVVHSCIDRIRAREPRTRAWIHFDEAQALDQARHLDAGPIKGPLHGVPVAVKDIMNTADMPTAFGTPIYAGHRPESDAACVAMLRDAGAVVMGKTVTTEFAYFRPGPTANPHNHAHTPGGSSSGSAAAVADGMAFVGLGSQTAASLIRPASYCGVVGFKSGYGSLPMAGIQPLAHSFDSLGWMTRRVEDAASLFAVFTGADWPRQALLRPSPVRIGLCRTPDWSHAEPSTVQALESVAGELAKAGAEVTEVALPKPFGRLTDLHKLIMAYEAARTLVSERSNHRRELSAPLRALLDQGLAVSFDDYRKAQAEAVRCRSRFDQLMEDWDVLLAPSAPGEAPRGLTATGNPIFSRMWTLLHVPTLSLPVATGEQGLPVGLQLIGRMNGEATLFGIGEWVQSELC